MCFMFCLAYRDGTCTRTNWWLSNLRFSKAGESITANSRELSHWIRMPVEALGAVWRRVH